jgi:hypothetical protein
MMKIALGSGVALMGIFLLCLTTTGCSGDSAVPADDLKIQGMSPGEYRDSQDAKGTGKVKKSRGARARH